MNCELCGLEFPPVGIIPRSKWRCQKCWNYFCYYCYQEGVNLCLYCERAQTQERIEKNQKILSDLNSYISKKEKLEEENGNRLE